MSDTSAFSCYVVGEDSLAVQCCELILSNGHKIKGIVSKHEQVITFAKKHDIAYFESIAAAKKRLLNDNFDYFFSIISTSLFGPDIINSPAKMAINFHNAPLPSYVGINASPWAILNGEKEHGITWHEITEKMDAGDILVQRRFLLDDTETSLSLNIKCYEHGILAFAELLEKLESQTLVAVKQDLSKRTFYSANKKAPGGGVFNWYNSAEQLSRIFRATYFDNHLNYFGSAKFILERMAFIPNRFEILKRKSKAQPGTIIAIDSDAIEVATSTHDISMGDFNHIDGHDYSVETLQAEFNLLPGFVLPSLSEKSLAVLDDVNLNDYKRERYWASRLDKVKPVPYTTAPVNCVLNREQVQVSQFSVNIKKLHELNILYPNCQLDNILQTLLLVYLYRINGYSTNFIAYHYPQLQTDPSWLKQFFSYHVPLFLDFTPEMTLLEAHDKFISQFENIKQYGSYPRDIRLRYPHLQKNYYKGVIALDLVKDWEHYQPETSRAFSVALSQDAKLCRIYRNQSINSSHALAMLDYIPQGLDIILESILDNPETQLKSLPLLSNKTKSIMLSDWNKTLEDYSDFPSIISQFEALAHSQGDVTAISFAGREELTYRQFYHRVNKLADFLNHKIGTHQSRIAGICLERSVELPLAIWACLKAGITYVPLDPKNPAKRLNHVLNDAELSMLITQSDLLKNFDKFKGKFIELDKSDKSDFEFEKNNIDLPQYSISREKLAYIIYTSGSTGLPKGVKINHHALQNFLLDMKGRFNLSEEDRWLAVTTPSFDIAVLELIFPLICGATIIVADHESIVDTRELISCIEQEDATIMQATPVTWQMLMDTNWGGKRGFRALCGGDAISPARAKNLVRLLGGFYHMYGPTETTIWSTVEHVDVETVEDISIGKPIANTQVYVLDKYLQALPAGTPGELYIAGDGLSNGYHNLPELSESRFINNPFYPDYSPFKKIYKTGDLVYWTSQAKLIYIGRIDAQAKIRGYRIELGSIEAHLTQYPGIAQAVANIYVDESSQKHLAAYIILDQNKSEIDVVDLQDFLGESLPSYMIPSSFSILTEFPLTSNLKVDRKSLPAPDKSTRTTQEPFVEPRDDIERKLVDIWQNILSLPAVGILDNFFNLGGNSLLITRVVLEIQKQFDIQIPLHSFFEAPTVANLAKIIKKDHGAHQKEDQSFIEDAKQQLDVRAINGISIDDPVTGIFLTGATGFLGAYFLRDLLNQYQQAKIYCLVRAKDTVNGLERVQNNLSKLKISLSTFDVSRIEILCGDIAKPNLGLSDALFRDLASSIDIIYHNAAYVHHIFDYKQLKSANVDSTHTLLRLASTYRDKPIHFISTLAALPKDKGGSVDEVFPNHVVTGVSSGYAKSKWVSESILKKASTQGMAVSIYRPPWVMGDARTGVVDAEENHLLRFIKGCIQLGYAPDWYLYLNILPVDFVSQTIVGISSKRWSFGQTYNVAATQDLSWSGLIGMVNSFGYGVDMLPYDQWHDKYLLKLHKDNAMYPLLPLYLNYQPNYPGQAGPLEIAKHIKCKNFQQAIKKLNMDFPAINESLIRRYFKQLISSGFLETPFV